MWLTGCPIPYEVESALFWNFSPIWTQNEHQNSTAKPALNGPNWPYCLAGRSEWLWWKKILCSFCVHMGEKFQKSTLPTSFYFVRVRAARQPHMLVRIANNSKTYFLSSAHLVFFLEVRVNQLNNKAKVCKLYWQPKYVAPIHLLVFS